MSASEYEIYCLKCRQVYPETGVYLNVCPQCGGILDVSFARSLLRESMVEALSRKGEVTGMWRWARLLPLRRPANGVTLGEGGTPLIAAQRLASSLNSVQLYIKDETRNPTGSFKDRPVSVAVSKACELGYTGVVTASSGNAGAAVSAYAARAGLNCLVFVPSRTPTSKLAQIELYGAEVMTVEGSFSDAFNAAEAAAQERGLVNVTTTFRSPYPTEANKTIAYELYEQLSGVIPDWIVAPVGSGPLPTGVFKGYCDLQSAGLAEKVPHILGVQAQGCSPIVRAFAAGTSVKAWENPQTIATGIADSLRGYEQDGDLMITRINESGGLMVAVDDEKILEAMAGLARLEGIGAEPSGAAGLAGVAQLARMGRLKKQEVVVVLVTGHALKDTKTIALLPTMEGLSITPKAPQAERG